MTIRFSIRKITIILVVPVLVIVFGIIFVVQKNTPNTPHGTSVFAPLDIVSGEVSTEDQKSTIQELSSLTNKKLIGSDLSIRPDSYKKTFSTTDDNYTVRFIVDISSAKSSYLVTVQIINGSSIGPYAECASDQKIGYSCVAPALEGE